MAVGWAIPPTGFLGNVSVWDPWISLRSWQSHWVTSQPLGPFKGMGISLFSMSSEYLQVCKKYMFKLTTDKSFLMVININFLLATPKYVQLLLKERLLKAVMNQTGPVCGDLEMRPHFCTGVFSDTNLRGSKVWLGVISRKLWLPTSKGTTSDFLSLLAVSQPWESSWAGSKIPQPLIEFGVLSSIKVSSEKIAREGNFWKQVAQPGEWDLQFYLF